MKRLLTVSAIVLLLSGCSEVYEQVIVPGLDSYMEEAGYSSEDRETVHKIGRSVAKSMDEINPEQEYYVGRTVAANVLSKYRPYADKDAQTYITMIGNLLTYKSDRPNTFGGYHFMILDSDEINAFAAPGGFIFVTRGMLRCSDTEDAVAAILAHEIAHVTNKHGLKSIKQSRWTRVGTLLGVEAAKRYTNEEIAELTAAFEESIDDIVNTLVVNGYSRESEIEADKTALEMLQRLGYNPAALLDMLQIMDKRLKPGGFDFARTHPAPSDRINAAKQGRVPLMVTPEIRRQRHHQYLANI